MDIKKTVHEDANSIQVAQNVSFYSGGGGEISGFHKTRKSLSVK
jgi:hypothetical protein